jgi:hypothetical protein
VVIRRDHHDLVDTANAKAECTSLYTCAIHIVAYQKDKVKQLLEMGAFKERMPSFRQLLGTLHAMSEP